MGVEATDRRAEVEKILRTVDLPGPPNVVEIAYRLGKDWTEDDAVFVWLVFADDTPEEHAADDDTAHRLVRREALEMTRRAEIARADWESIRKTEAAGLFLLALAMPALARFQRRAP